MKKALLSILAAIYMIVSTGMVIQVNYCMGKVSDLSLLPVEKAPCSMCGAPKPGTLSSHCCSSETKFFKLGDDQKQLETAYTGMQPVLNSILPAFTDSDSGHFSSSVSTKIYSHPPPLRSPGVAIYLLHRSFLI